MRESLFIEKNIKMKTISLWQPWASAVAVGSKTIETRHWPTNYLIACEKTNRKCYSLEIDEHYVDVSVKRWENYTGNKAILDV